MTKADVRKRARGAYEDLAAISAPAADEARTQAGLPEVWVWDALTMAQLGALAVACRLRLLEVA